MAREGIVADVRNIASDGLRMIRTRLELLAIEVQEQKALIVRQLIIASATLFFVSFGMQLVILWLALSLDEGQRQAVLGGLGAAFLLAGAGCAYWLHHKRSRNPLASTLDVLKRDESALRGALAQPPGEPALKGGDD